MQSHAEFTLIFDTVFSTFSSNDLKLGEFLWAKSKSYIYQHFKQHSPPTPSTQLSFPARKQETGYTRSTSWGRHDKCHSVYKWSAQTSVCDVNNVPGGIGAQSLVTELEQEADVRRRVWSSAVTSWPACWQTVWESSCPQRAWQERSYRLAQALWKAAMASGHSVSSRKWISPH